MSIDLDGSGVTDISTGIPFYDHMLDQLGRHGGFDLRVQAVGDLHIDTHHTVEDVAIASARRSAEALGDKAGVRRFASGLYPLDEALVEVALDLSGRPFVVWDVPMPECLPLGNPAFDPQLAEHAVVVVRHRGRRSRCTSTLRARAQRAPHHRGDVQGPGPLACATRCGSRARRCRRPRACCDAMSDATADRRARLRHRQPALGAEGARAVRRRCPPHRRSPA